MVHLQVNFLLNVVFISWLPGVSRPLLLPFPALNEKRRPEFEPWWRQEEKKSASVVNHAGRAPCKIDAACLPACRSPQLYKFAPTLCLLCRRQVFVRGCLRNSAQLVFLRDEEESVSRLYLKWETTGILMDCTGGRREGFLQERASGAQTHLFSNQDDAFVVD